MSGLGVKAVWPMDFVRAYVSPAFAHWNVGMLWKIDFVAYAFDCLKKSPDLRIERSIDMTLMPCPMGFAWIEPCSMFPGDAFPVPGVTVGYWKSPMILICLAGDEGGSD
jgi:hypothetical protein